MPDCYDTSKRSEVMSRIRSSGTSPEAKLAVLLAKWLPAVPIIPQDKLLFGRPDFHIPSLNLAIFVDGCFFHGCPLHYRAPSQNGEYWKKKVARNKQRDKVVTKTLRAEAVTVLRIWEHELRGSGVPGRERIRRRIRRVQQRQVPSSSCMEAERSSQYHV